MKELKIPRSEVKSQKWGAALCVALLVGLPLAGQVAKEANGNIRVPRAERLWRRLWTLLTANNLSGPANYQKRWGSLLA